MSSESPNMCSRCIYDATIPAITFDEENICNYCRLTEKLEREYGTGTSVGEAKYAEQVARIKTEGKGKKYDCVVGVSGGTDSSYMLYLAVEAGLRPLAVHYDNTWNSAIATENIRKITKQLGVDLSTHVVNNKEMDDIYRAFLSASVPAIDVPTDIALTEVLYRAAAKHRVGYILEGHSFRTEGVTPLGYSYFDGKYIQSIHRQYGTMKMRTFPNMTFWPFMKWVLVKRIRKVRPLWYLAYSKQEAQKFLMEKFGWVYYGGHHLENRMTAFSMSYHNPVKFGIDQRIHSLAAAARAGFMTREEALAAIKQPPHLEDELLDYLKKRLGYSNKEFDLMMRQPPRSFREFKTYKKTFERLRPLFYVLARMNLVPMSFYIKYTSKSEI